MKPTNFIVTGINGSVVDFLNLGTSTIVLADIAERLAAIPRFNGGTKTLYTVAQHSLAMLYLLTIRRASPKVQQLALMHDMTEAFMGDMVSPLKALFPAFSKLEADLFEIICCNLRVTNDFTGEEWAEIKAVDRELCLAEWYVLNDNTIPDAGGAWRTVYGNNPTPTDQAIEAVSRVKGAPYDAIVRAFSSNVNEISYVAEFEREQEAK